MGFPRYLPFERGTRAQGDSITAADGDFSQYVGRCFSTKDTENGTSHDVVLRVVQLDSAIDIADFRRGLKFSVLDTGDYGSHMVGSTSGYPTEGQFGKPLDDAYSGLSTGFVANSIVYCVDEGPVEVLSSTDSLVSMSSPGIGVAISGDGLFFTAADADVIVGTLLTSVVSTSRMSTCVVYINGGLNQSAAGAATS